MPFVLPKETIDFIQSLTHDDLVCFLQVYDKSLSDTDRACCKAIKDELINKVAKEDNQLWDKEQN